MLKLDRRVAAELIAVLVLGAATFARGDRDAHSAGTRLRQSGHDRPASRGEPGAAQDQVRDFSHD